jgi:hypothetical protein
MSALVELPVPEWLTASLFPFMTPRELRDRLERWRALIASVSIDGPLPIQFRAYPLWGKIVIEVIMSTRDRDGRLGEAHIALRKVVRGEPDVNWLRARAQELYQHELDEWFLVEGRRLFDPHKGDHMLALPSARTVEGGAP